MNELLWIAVLHVLFVYLICVLHYDMLSHCTCVEDQVLDELLQTQVVKK